MLPVSVRRVFVLDVVGSVLSTLCALHCAALPLIVMALPFAADPEFEAALLAVVVLVALTAIGAGALRHRRYTALIPLALGLPTLAAAVLLEAHALSIVGSVLVVSAHFLNARSCRAAHAPSAA